MTSPTARAIEPRRVRGEVDDGFGPVMDVFDRNFRERGDLGAACAVYVGGRKVVDLWGGLADRRWGRPWTSDTSAVIFSCSKGILAVCAYLLVQEGRLDLDAPVARYWPEFGQADKEGIPVRWLLSHRAGLPALDRDFGRAPAGGARITVWLYQSSPCFVSHQTTVFVVAKRRREG